MDLCLLSSPDVVVPFPELLPPLLPDDSQPLLPLFPDEFLPLLPDDLQPPSPLLPDEFQLLFPLFLEDSQSLLLFLPPLPDEPLPQPLLSLFPLFPPPALDEPPPVLEEPGKPMPLPPPIPIPIPMLGVEIIIDIDIDMEFDIPNREPELSASTFETVKVAMIGEA